VAHAGADLDRVGLDLHPPATAVPELAPRHVCVERVAVEREPAASLDDRDEAGPCDSPRGEAERVMEPRLSAWTAHSGAHASIGPRGRSRSRARARPADEDLQARRWWRPRLGGFEQRALALTVDHVDTT